MTVDDYLRISTIGIQTAVFVSAPVLLLGLVAGLVVSIFQAATQINEQTLSFLPRFITTIGAVMMLGSWMLSKLTDFIDQLFRNIPYFIN